jgi:hypothetical protein
METDNRTESAKPLFDVANKCYGYDSVQAALHRHHPALANAVVTQVTQVLANATPGKEVDCPPGYVFAYYKQKHVRRMGITVLPISDLMEDY